MYSEDNQARNQIQQQSSKNDIFTTPLRTPISSPKDRFEGPSLFETKNNRYYKNFNISPINLGKKTPKKTTSD